MISIAEALQLVLGEVRPLASDRLSLEEAHGRILAEEVRAPRDVPAFANSQMDGYAVRAADVAGASPSSPVQLRVLGVAAAGRPLDGAVTAGGAVRIMTGAPLPDGADAVIPVEETRSGGEEAVWIEAAARPGRFVRPPGEDLAAGEVVLPRGRSLRPADIGLLASIGCQEVAVSRRPSVAIVGTGDELVPLGQPLGAGQIHDSNAYVLGAAVREAGGVPHLLGIVRDDRGTLRRTLEDSVGYDVVLSTGGVSVGDFDYVKEVMDEVGLRRLFWKVAQKPGKPITFAAREGRLHFGLPGNPVSALVCFLVYVAPALRALQGREGIHAPTATVTCGESITTARDLTELVRCTVREEGGDLVARPTGTQSSGALRSLSLADGLLISSPGRASFEAGERATVLVIRPGAEPIATHPFP